MGIGLEGILFVKITIKKRRTGHIIRRNVLLGLSARLAGAGLRRYNNSAIVIYVKKNSACLYKYKLLFLIRKQ